MFYEPASECTYFLALCNLTTNIEGNGIVLFLLNTMQKPSFLREMLQLSVLDGFYS
jgi:hypothetical protein